MLALLALLLCEGNEDEELLLLFMATLAFILFGDTIEDDEGKMAFPVDP